MAVRRRGLTLMEVVISSLLVGTVLVTSLSSTASWRRFQLQTSQQETSRRLAEELISEITSTAFIDPRQSTPVALGREAGELTTSRSNWNDVDDYHGMTETTLRDKSGSAIGAAAGYTRSVAVSPAVPMELPPGYEVSSELNSPLRRIVVTVTSPSGQTAIASGLRSNVDVTFPSALKHLRSVTVDVGDNGVSTVRSVSARNHPQVIP